MALQLMNDHTNTTSDTLAKFREEPPKNFEAGVLFTNRASTGVTLADMKTVHFGISFPKNMATGVVRSGYIFRLPLANRADGSPRFCMRLVTDYCPADATANELVEFRLNTQNITNSSEAHDLVQSGIIST